MFNVGITGGIGSGKSLVCRMLGILGVPVFDADAEGRAVLGTDPEVLRQVIAAFGADMVTTDGVDRRKLAEQVFADPAALDRLNGIVHPIVRARSKAWSDEQNAPYVVTESAILIESGGAARFDHLVVVIAPEEVRLRRVMERDGIDADHVRQRMAAQCSDQERRGGADSVIVNDGERMLLPQVLALHQRLLELAEHHG
ncbi:MAG: dephospho-CoA kinase [Flavobacteriales bacterium]|nr:dephospho-CoA kinase [Flavobacteriales bacterium]MCB9193897.1 dephospho-CoA kinase [Flavobacteriales bacterium]